MIDVAQYEQNFREAQEIANEVAIKMSIARQGIDPELISRQDFDRIMRCNMAILDIREKANIQINQINQAAAVEHNKLVQKIQEALARYHPEAQITPVPEPVVEAETVGKAEEVLA